MASCQIRYAIQVCLQSLEYLDQTSSFSKLHLARSQVRPSATRLLFELEVEDDYSFNFTAKKQRPLEGFSLELTQCFNYKDMFICSNHCNGLVCLYSSKDAQVYLFNVTTREIKALPAFSMDHDDVKYPNVFLGFDMVTGKYKLLHIFMENKIRRVTRILTLGTNSWRRIIVPTNCFISRTRHIYLHGFLYALNTFACFNFTEEKFGNLPRIQDKRLNIMQTALRGELVIRSCTGWGWGWGCEEGNVIYDGLNKVFTKLVDYPETEKVALLETGTIDMTKSGNIVLATASTIGAPTSLLPPYLFWLISVSSYVENITPLASLV